jgi:hypothetical protein
MCRCVTTADVIKMINKKREAKGLDALSYQAFLIHYRSIKNFMPPTRQIGPSYVFSASVAKRIVSTVWKVRYRKIPRVNWEMYRVA